MNPVAPVTRARATIGQDYRSPLTHCATGSRDAHDEISQTRTLVDAARELDRRSIHQRRSLTSRARHPREPAATPITIEHVKQPRRNIELKAYDPDPDRSLNVCRTLGAEDHGDIWQQDTYFQVASGGLKLREERPGRPHLIQFHRANEPQQRESRYRIIEVDDGAVLSAALAATIGIRGVVTKRRRLFLWQKVRIHLDDVEQLGRFIELEAVAPPDSDLTHEHRLVIKLREALGITDERLVAFGYAEQLLRPPAA
jgi:adenylate cyclase class IV